MKSSTEDASLGIAQASVVEDAAKLKERIEFIHEQIGSDALVEEYIEGRELYVGVIGNERLTRLPVWEMASARCPQLCRADRHPQGEVGPRLPGELRHHHRTPPRSSAGGVARLDRLSQAHLPGAASVRLCAHGLSAARRRRGVRARGQCQSEPGRGRGFRRSRRAPRACDYADVLRRILKLGVDYPAAWRGVETEEP